jgi:hypothetical protein
MIQFTRSRLSGKIIALTLGLFGGLAAYVGTSVVQMPVAQAGCGASGELCGSDTQCSGGYSDAVCRRKGGLRLCDKAIYTGGCF